MRFKSIFWKLLVPFIIGICIFAALTLGLSSTLYKSSYEKELILENTHTSSYVASSVESFMDKAYKITVELANLSDVISMNTFKQNTIVKGAAKRNDYFELVYIQDMNGDQTARSTGTLGNRANRWWFQEMLERKTAFISKSYYSVSTNMTCASVFVPLMSGNTMVGIFATDIKLSSLQDIVEDYSDLETGKSCFIIDGEGAVVAHPESVYFEELYNYKTLTKTVTKKDGNGQTIYDSEGNVATEELPIEISSEYAAVINDVMSGNSGNNIITDNNIKYYVSYAPVNLGGTSDSWSVITLQNADAALEVVNNITIIGITATFVAVVIAIIIMISIARSITNPLKQCVINIKDLANGNLSTNVPKSEGCDEIAELQNTLYETVSNLNMMTQQITDYVKAVEDGDFTQTMNKNFKGDFNILATSIQAVSNSVRNTLHNVTIYCKTLINNINTLDAGTRQLADGTTNQASAIEELSATLADISEKISANAEASKVSNTKMNTVKTSVADSSIHIKALNDAMLEIEANSNEINGISRIIQNIASQTNLLSMNASVEASRAGEAGKGFAVVAAEVRHLAEKCNEAAHTTADLIEKTCDNISDSMKALDTTTESINSVAQESNETSIYLTDIATASNEQAEAIAQISGAVDQISNVTQQNSINAADSARISNEMKQDIATLGRILSQYKY